MAIEGPPCAYAPAAARAKSATQATLTLMRACNFIGCDWGTMVELSFARSPVQQDRDGTADKPASPGVAHAERWARDVVLHSVDRSFVQFSHRLPSGQTYRCSRYPTLRTLLMSRGLRGSTSSR